MRSTTALPAALLAALAVWAAPAAGLAAEIRFRGTNQNLEEARALVGKARYEEALEELKTAEALPGNTNRHSADLAMLRASALLGLPPNPERTQQAKDALITLFHVDAEGASLLAATDGVKALALQLKGERALLLHDRLVTVRSGRPLRLRARLSNGPPGAALYLRYRTEPEVDAKGDRSVSPVSQGSPVSTIEADEFVRVQLEARTADSFEVFLRPGVGGVPADGEHVIRYYLEALDSAGRPVDQNGTARDPIRVQLSETRTEGAGVGGADAVIATLDEGGKMAHPPPPAPPPVPWFKRWEIVGPIGGALVIGGVVAAVLLQPKPQPPAGALGTVNLP